MQFFYSYQILNMNNSETDTESEEYNNMNSIRFHRRMAALHFTTMMAQPFLAKKAVENGKRYNELMDAHLKAGTVAFFALSLDALGITFFK